MLFRLGRYFRPHLFAVLASVSFFWLVRWFMSLSGSCSFFCNPPVNVTLGALAGLLGAQLYRNDHPP